ncbi:MAG: shikimate kinase [Oscillospiraceae bacterium]|nr:shikimate kinase [Oscillospiraceae bacterium]MDY2847638.1 shikimate kinase [Oscillospiraceae bacterium]
MTVFLCGFMGCGKSTVGRELAALMDKPFTDMDSYIEKKAGMSIPEIFAEKGEKAFRTMETSAVKELAASDEVVACGGGAMLKSENAEAAAAGGIVVYLDADYETCYKRISGDKNRPIVMANTKESLEGIYNDRKALYTANSQISIKAEGTPAQIAERIREAVSD